jgi:hypothetical protein
MASKIPNASSVICNKTTDDRGEVVTPSKEEGVESHICSSLMSEGLEWENILLNYSHGKSGLGRLTTPVTDIPGNASIGAAKKPARTFFLAIH